MTYPINWAWWRFSEEESEVGVRRHHANSVPLLTGDRDEDARVECQGGSHGHGRTETNLGEYIGDNRGAWRSGR